MDPASVTALLRGLHLAAMLSLLGAAGFGAWLLPGSDPAAPAIAKRVRRLCWLSGVAALAAGTGWFVAEASAISGASGATELIDALPLVAWHTRFGNVLLARLGLLAVATVLAAVRFRFLLILIPVAAATVLEGLIGHAGATAGRVGQGLVLSEALHLLAAGLWLGALVPLILSVRRLAPQAAAEACERFTPIGLACVLVLAGTGLAQALELIGSIPALLGTPYGHIALIKIGLFLLALILAALNRLHLTDRLARTGRPSGLLLSVTIETVIGVAIVLAAAFLASTQPAAHTNPVWPLSWRFTLATVTEDPDFRREVIVSFILMGLAAVLLVAALLAGRWRWTALGLLTAAIIWRGPSLSLLTAEAYPTSFQTSPTGFSASSIVRGQHLFPVYCAACHGADGRGNGPAAAGMGIKPTDLAELHVRMHSDGDMIWWLSHGIEDPEGAPGGKMAMPGFSAVLPTDDLWALIDYVRAHNAGEEMRNGEAFEIPIRAPRFAITCDGPDASSTADLRGNAVLIEAGSTTANQPPIPPQNGIETITVSLGRSRPSAGGCAAGDQNAWDAYAILAGVPSGLLDGIAFLVDPNGWLRAIHSPDGDGGWHTRDDLIAMVRRICANPIAETGGAEHDHHH